MRSRVCAHLMLIQQNSFAQRTTNTADRMCVVELTSLLCSTVESRCTLPSSIDRMCCHWVSSGARFEPRCLPPRRSAHGRIHRTTCAMKRPLAHDRYMNVNGQTESDKGCARETISQTKSIAETKRDTRISNESVRERTCSQVQRRS